MAKKLSKTERIFQALINGEKLSGKTVLQRFPIVCYFVEEIKNLNK